MKSVNNVKTHVKDLLRDYEELDEEFDVEDIKESMEEEEELEDFDSEELEEPSEHSELDQDYFGIQEEEEE